MTSRSRLVRKRSVRTSTAAVLRKRTKSKLKTSYKSSDILPFKEGVVLKPLLSGPMSDSFRHGDFLHVSDLIYKCSRKIALSHRYKRPMKGQEIFDSLGLTFAMGNSMHDYIRNKIAIKHPDKIFGKWSCVCGRTFFTGTKQEALMESACKHCKGEMHSYGEVQVVHEGMGVTGSIDLTLLVNNAFIITEIKSMARRYWDELIRPQPEHLIQVLLYWHLAKEAGYSIHDKVSIIYAVKDFIFQNPYKEFVLQPSKVIHRIEDYLRDAILLRAAITNKEAPLPVRLLCPNIDSPEARKCDLSTICFNTD